LPPAGGADAGGDPRRAVRGHRRRADRRALRPKAPVREGDFELVTLRGGAQAVRDVRRGEVMHPAGGPWAEARRLYAEQLGVRERVAVEGAGPLRVLDVGLGAAANAVAVLSAAAGAPRAVELCSLEVDLAPLRLAVRAPEAFPFLQPWRAALEGLIARGEWASGAVRWRLLQGDAREERDLRNRIRGRDQRIPDRPERAGRSEQEPQRGARDRAERKSRSDAP